MKQHGQSKTALYGVWCGMRERCNNPNHISYKYYGGKGVSVCPEWHDFVSFQEWALAHGYTRGYWIDRIDGDGDYEPSNCRFIPRERSPGNRPNFCRDYLGVDFVPLPKNHKPWHRRQHEWRAMLWLGRSPKTIGYYPTATEAAIARDLAIEKYRLPHKKNFTT